MPDKKTEEKYEVKQVSTQTAPFVINNETGDPITTEEAIAILLNQQQKLLEKLE